MNGLQMMQAMVSGDMPHPPICATIPMKAVHVARGEIQFEARADKRHTNPLGGVHGGFAATVLDSVTGCAAHTLLEEGVGYGTIDLTLQMMRPVPLGQTLIAEGEVINASKSLVFARGTLSDAQGKLLAHATATCKIISKNS